MFNPHKIKELVDNSKLSDKKFTINKLCRAVVITPAGLKGITERGAFPKVDTLERIANYFGVDMNYFFDIQTKKTEIEEISIKMTDGNEYILKRFEELIQENTKLKSRVEELETIKKYTLSNVPLGKVAEKPIKLETE